VNPLTGDFDLVVQIGTVVVDDGLARLHHTGEMLRHLAGPVAHGPSGWRGAFKAQISTPTVSIRPEVANRLTAHVHVMARATTYAGSVAPPEAVHGVVHVTAGLDHVTGADARVTFDLRAAEVDVAFEPIAPPLAPEILETIRAVITDLMTHAVQPVTLVLPSLSDTEALGVRRWRVGTVGSALAVGVNLAEAAAGAALGRPALREHDQLMVAVADDFVEKVARRELGGARFRARGRTFMMDGASVRVRASSGSIKLSLVVREIEDDAFARGGLRATVTQRLAVRVSDRRLEIHAVGDLELDISGGGLEGAILSLFEGLIADRLEPERDGMLRRASAELTLALTRLLDGVTGDLPIPGGVLASLARAETVEHGIVVGVAIRFPSLGSPVAWLDATWGAREDGLGLELDAYRSWIPGGTPTRYVFTLLEGGARRIEIAEEHRFFTRPPVRPSVDPRRVGVWCLRVEGIQGRTATGAPNRVQAEYCPVVGPLPILVDLGIPGHFLVGVDVGSTRVAHVDAFNGNRGSTGYAPWLLVVAGGAVHDSARLVAQAVGHRARSVGALHVVLVGEGALDPGLTPPSKTDVAFLPTDDPNRRWRTALGLEQGAGLVLLEPSGRERFRVNGLSAPEVLGQVLDQLLTEPAALRFGPLEPRIRAGSPTPNVRIDLQGKPIGLHRLRGRPTMVLFVAGWSSPSIEELGRVAGLQRTDGFRVVAIGTGQTDAQMKALAAGRQLDVLTVGDGTLKVTRHWGVTCWPTGILIDPNGLVQSVQLGKYHAGPARPN
jgi:hypothetical protein